MNLLESYKDRKKKFYLGKAASIILLCSHKKALLVSARFPVLLYRLHLSWARFCSSSMGIPKCDARDFIFSDIVTSTGEKET